MYFCKYEELVNIALIEQTGLPGGANGKTTFSCEKYHKIPHFCQKNHIKIPHFKKSFLHGV